MGKIMKEGIQYGLGGTQKASEITYGSGTVADALDSLQTITATYGNITAYRTGNVVSLEFGYTSTAFSKGWNVLGTLDAVFRPRGSSDYVILDNGATSQTDYPLQIRINPANGQVALYSWSAKNLSPIGTITYVV